MNIKYTLGAALSLPLLPILYLQGNKVKNSIPKLPEAAEPEGFVNINAKENLRIITIGESTIAGVGVRTHEEGFSGTLAKNLANALQKNVYWNVYAKSGYTAKLVLERLLPKISIENPDLIVIGLGGNDSFRLNSPKKWGQDIDNLILSLKLKFKNTPIVFTNIPPIKDFPAFTSLIKFTIGNLSEILGDTLEKQLKKYDDVYFNAEKITLKGWIAKFNLKNTPAAFFSDGVHPSLLTYQTWAVDMANFIHKNVLTK